MTYPNHIKSHISKRTDDVEEKRQMRSLRRHDDDGLPGAGLLKVTDKSEVDRASQIVGIGK